MPKEIFFGQPEKPKASIPDDDAVGWINTLREGGFTQSEIDSVMSHLNKTYRDQKYPKEERIEAELKKTEEYLFKKYGQKMDNEKREYLRRSISEREEFKD